MTWPANFSRVVARLGELLPAGLNLTVTVVGDPGTLLFEGWFPRAWLSRPTPHGEVTVVLDNFTRVRLPHGGFVPRGGLLVGGDGYRLSDDLSLDQAAAQEEGPVRVQFKFAFESADVICELGVREV